MQSKIDTKIQDKGIYRHTNRKVVNIDLKLAMFEVDLRSSGPGFWPWVE